MKTLTSLALGMLLTGWITVNATDVETGSSWLIDLPKAVEQAKKENKIVLADFTGSDWCPWCIRLHEEVFSKPDFAAYAKRNLVLVTIDFPHNKPQPAEVKKVNAALAEKYSIEGFPTVLVLDGNGKVLDRLNYEPGGPKPFVAKIEALKKNSKTKS
jgi:thioredoxin-related protein